VLHVCPLKKCRKHKLFILSYMSEMNGWNKYLRSKFSINSSVRKLKLSKIIVKYRIMYSFIFFIFNPISWKLSIILSCRLRYFIIYLLEMSESGIIFENSASSLRFNVDTVDKIGTKFRVFESVKNNLWISLNKTFRIE